VIAEGVKVLLSVLIDPRATGMYEIADKLVMLARAPTSALVGPMLAAFAELRAAGERARESDMLRRGWKAVAIISSSVACFLAITADPALLAWTGRDVPLAAWAVQMMVLANLCSQQTAVHSSSLRAEGNVRLEFWFAIISSGIAVVLLVALVGINPFFAVVASRAIAQTAGAAWYLGAFLRHAKISVGEWWRGGSIGRVLAISASAAAFVAIARSLVGKVPLPITPRWYAVLDVCVWGIPYAAVVGVGMWKYVLDDEERTRLREMIGRKLAKLRRR
jgi:O-antigen/teichoic acid export membrane protein